jgi:phosphonate transport system substrate-binding protein
VALTLLMPPSLGAAKATARAELFDGALSQELGEAIEVAVAPTYKDLCDRALAGRVHMVWAPAGICSQLEPTARAIFKVVRYQSTTARSALVAKKKDRLSMARLKGKRAAWVDPLSVGGYLLAVAHLRRCGVEPDLIFATQVFLGNHPAVCEAVLHGEADVGAVTIGGDDDAMVSSALRTYVGAAADHLHVIELTASAPTDAFVLCGSIPQPMADKIAQVLSPGWAKTPWKLLSILEAECLVPARSGEFDSVAALLRG